MNYRSYFDLAKLIDANLSKLTAENFDLIVGVPRSGVVPAYMIALNLNVSVCSLYDLLNNNIITRDGTRQIKNEISYPHDANRILIVDDSYNSGSSLSRNLSKLPSEIRKKVKTLAIFAASDNAEVDYFFEVVPQPRCFEWNIFHHDGWEDIVCYDMDGVLCDDPTQEENDDGDNYVNFIRNAQPKIIPTYKIRTIVSSRLEKYRNDTEYWLRKNNIKYDNLVLLDGYTAEERRTRGVHGSFKAQEYEKQCYELFIESELAQAIEINGITGKPVYCVSEHVMINTAPLRQEARVVNDTRGVKADGAGVIVSAILAVKHKTRVRTRIRNLFKNEAR